MSDSQLVAKQVLAFNELDRLLNWSSWSHQDVCIPFQITIGHWRKLYAVNFSCFLS